MELDEPTVPNVKFSITKLEQQLLDSDIARSEDMTAGQIRRYYLWMMNSALRAMGLHDRSEEPTFYDIVQLREQIKDRVSTLFYMNFQSGDDLQEIQESTGVYELDGIDLDAYTGEDSTPRYRLIEEAFTEKYDMRFGSDYFREMYEAGGIENMFVTVDTQHASGTYQTAFVSDLYDAYDEQRKDVKDFISHLWDNFDRVSGTFHKVFPSKNPDVLKGVKLIAFLTILNAAAKKVLLDAVDRLYYEHVNQLNYMKYVSYAMKIGTVSLSDLERKKLLKHKLRVDSAVMDFIKASDFFHESRSWAKIFAQMKLDEQRGLERMERRTGRRLMLRSERKEAVFSDIAPEVMMMILERVDISQQLEEPKPFEKSKKIFYLSEAFTAYINRVDPRTRSRVINIDFGEGMFVLPAMVDQYQMSIEPVMENMKNTLLQSGPSERAAAFSSQYKSIFRKTYIQFVKMRDDYRSLAREDLSDLYYYLDDRYTPTKMKPRSTLRLKYPEDEEETDIYPLRPFYKNKPISEYTRSELQLISIQKVMKERDTHDIPEKEFVPMLKRQFVSMMKQNARRVNESIFYMWNILTEIRTSIDRGLPARGSPSERTPKKRSRRGRFETIEGKAFPSEKEIHRDISAILSVGTPKIKTKFSRKPVTKKIQARRIQTENTISNEDDYDWVF